MDKQNHVHFDSAYYVHSFELNNTVSNASVQGNIYLPNNFTNGQYFYIQFLKLQVMVYTYAQMII